MNDTQTGHSPSSPTDAGSTTGSVAADLKAAATDTLDRTVTEVRTRADDAKAEVATDVRNVADALRRASEELRDGSAQERTLGQIASSLADASDAIRDKDLGEIVRMVGRAGREQPVLFLGGAALLGFAASRFAKASGGPDHTASADRSAHRGSPVADYRSPRRGSPVTDFVDEGNPNTQPGGIAS